MSRARRARAIQPSSVPLHSGDPNSVTALPGKLPTLPALNRPLCLDRFGAVIGQLGLFHHLHDEGLLPFDPNSKAMGALRGYGPTLAALVAAAIVLERNGVSAP